MRHPSSGLILLSYFFKVQANAIQNHRISLAVTHSFLVCAEQSKIQNAYANIVEEMKEKADRLVKILRLRMQQLMNCRGVDNKRREHWVINAATLLK